MKVQPSSNSVLGSHTQVFPKKVTLRTLASHWLVLSLGLGYSSQYCMYLYTLFISSQHIPLAGHDRFCRVSQVQVCLTVLLSEIVQLQERDCSECAGTSGQNGILHYQ